MNEVFYYYHIVCHGSRRHRIKFVRHYRCAGKQKKKIFFVIMLYVIEKKNGIRQQQPRRRRQFPSRPVATCTGYVRQPERVPAVGDDETRENKPIEYVFISVRWHGMPIMFFFGFFKTRTYRRAYVCMNNKPINHVCVCARVPEPEAVLVL